MLIFMREGSSISIDTSFSIHYEYARTLLESPHLTTANQKIEIKTVEFPYIALYGWEHGVTPDGSVSKRPLYSPRTENVEGGTVSLSSTTVLSLPIDVHIDNTLRVKLKCYDCDEVFSNRNQQREHIILHHSAITVRRDRGSGVSVQCPLCPLLINQMAAMYMHLKDKHDFQSSLQVMRGFVRQIPMVEEY